MEQMRKLPIGIQTFEKLREENYLYVDKTALVYRIASTSVPYFLSRPRRFGKSLLISTFEAYFQGRKDLFEGLAIEKLETEWKEYPVFHLDLNAEKYDSKEALEQVLSRNLSLWEDRWGKDAAEDTLASRFAGVLRRTYEQTGKQVVILIDEYDAPLLDSNHHIELQDKLRNEMRKFFSPLKAQGQYIRFLFLTGISKFSQMSIFSELNNLQNISMSDDYSAICGITEEELRTQLKTDIERIGLANDETYEEACVHLKKQYDGYHFSKQCEDIYNPFSLFNAFAQKSYENYWFSTGTPTFLIKLLQKINFNIRDLEHMDTKAEDFDKATEHISDPIPILYQSGYLTIKGYNPLFRSYTLGYPNEEVKIGFLESLIPSYLDQPTRESNFYVMSFVKDLMKGDVESCMIRTRSFFASIPNDLNNKSEKHYQTIFYLIFRLMGQYVETEVKSAIGRTDVVVKMQDAIYVFEFKMDGTAKEALAQINSKGYAIPYEADKRKVVKIGANFNSGMRTVEEWIIEEAPENKV